MGMERRTEQSIVSYVKLIEPPLAEPHERWCERSEIPQSEEFPPTRFAIVVETRIPCL